MLRVSLVAGAFASVIGCSLVNDPSAHTGVEPIPATEFCNEFAHLACETADACCTLGDPTRSCVTEMRAYCDTTFGATLLDDPRTGYDGVRAAAAFARARALASTCDVTIYEWYVDQRAGFSSALSGTVAGGEICTPESLPPDPVDIAALYSCDDDDQACVFNGVDRFTCTARAAVGQSCFLNFDCRDGLYCARAVGTCAPKRGVGSPCTAGGGECLGACIADLCAAPERATIYCAFAPIDVTAP